MMNRIITSPWFLKMIIIWGVLCCMCCEVTSSPTPLPAELTNLTVCRGRNADGLPIALPEIIPPTEPQICICGDLKADEEGYLQVFWAYEQTDLQDDVAKWRNGPITSCITKDNGFAAGNYGVAVVLWKSTVGFIEFTVGGEEP